MVHLFKPTSYRKGTALAIGATAIWKGVSFVNALLLAAYFGAHSTTDLYFYLILTIGVGLFFLQRLNTAVIIPQAMVLEVNEPEKSRALLNGYLYVYAGVCGLIILCGVFLPQQTVTLFSRFEATCIYAQRALVTWAFVFFALQIWVTYLLAILEMYKRFATALFAPFNAILPLVCLLLFGRTTGVISMLYGFVISYGVQAVIFSIMLKKELHWKLTRGEIYHSAAFMKNLVSNQLIELADIVSGILPLYLLSGLSAGTLSALNYARQLSDSSNEVLTSRVTNISKIQLTEYAAKERWTAFNTTYNTTHFFLWFILTPLVIFSVYFAPEIITIFFKRGAFSAENVQEAAAFLRPLLGIVWLMVPILMQNNVVAATRQLKAFLPYALAGILIFIAAVPGAVYAWGAVAYAYTQLICCVIGLTINAFFFLKYVPQFALKPALKDGARLVGLNLLALLPAGICAWYTGNNTWITVLISGIIFVSVLTGLMHYSGDLKRFLGTASAHH